MPREARETKVVEVVVNPEISPEQIAELIVRVGSLGPGGRDCRTCGLIGVDLRLTGQDPEIDPPPGAHSMLVS
jgi:hypothetical protein